MFSILPEKLGPLDTLKILNSKTGEYVAIIPCFGATLNELTLKKGEMLYSLVDGCDSYEDLLTEGKLRFKGPKLFPFPNRIKDGKYSFEGKEYQLRKNFISQGHAAHGLQIESNFKVIGKNIEPEKASVQLEYNSGGQDTGYPFKYKLIIDYTLHSTQGLSCKTTVTNNSETNIPVGDGWHPYIKLETPIDNLKLQIPSCSRLESDNRMIPTGIIFKEERFKKPEQLESTLLDDCFVIEANEKIAEIHLINENRNIEMILWQEAGKDKYGYFQLYTPPHRESIAIEPMTCAPDAFNNKLGLIILHPGESADFNYGIRLQ
jgi:aldose 1-epimerase